MFILILRYEKKTYQIFILTAFNLLIKSSFYRLYMYKYAVNIMSVPEIIDRSQE